VKRIYKKLRKSANREDCTLNINGVCNYNSETTVLAHLPSEFKGVGIKSPDFCACFACSSCHDVIDGRAKHFFDDVVSKEWFMRRAQTRTLLRWVELGLVVIK
jgi:hypothetical protein